MQLVTSDSGVAAGTRWIACCGGVPALADDVLGEGVAARLMSVVATVAFVVPLKRGNVLGDRGQGGNGSSSSFKSRGVRKWWVVPIIFTASTLVHPGREVGVSPGSLKTPCLNKSMGEIQ